MEAGVLMLFTFCINTFSAANPCEWQQNPQFESWRIGASSPEHLTQPGTRALACSGTTLDVSPDKWPRLLRRTIPWRSILKIYGDDWENERFRVEVADFGRITIDDAPPQRIEFPETDWSYGLADFSSESGDKLRIWMSRTFPGVLSHTNAGKIAFFTGDNAPRPRFCALGTEAAQVTQIQEHTKLGQRMSGGSWLLVWFGDAFNSSRFSPYVVCSYPADCPVLFFFQREPAEISFENGMEVTFEGDDGAGYVVMLPIFGDSYPLAIAEDDTLLEQLPRVHFNHGDVPANFKRYFYPPGFETASWSQKLPESVVETCNWWAEHLHQIPVSVKESYIHDGDMVTIEEQFDFIQLMEGGKSLSPIPPMLAIAAEEGFPIDFSGPVMKTSVLTAHGPFSGLEGVQEYTWRISGLSRYVFADRDSHGDGDAPQELRGELESEVRKILDSGELAPWYPVMDDDGAGYMGYYDRGYRGHFLFSNPAETFYFLAEAYPLLRPETRKMALDYLRKLRTEHPPEELYFAPMGHGAPRERYRPTPQSIVDRLNTHFNQSNFYVRMNTVPEKNLYYLARYYDLTGDIAEVKQKWDQMQEILTPYLNSLDWGTMGFRRRPTTWSGRAGLGGVIDVNSFFAALIGGIRLAGMAEDEESEQMLWGIFAKTAALRFAMGKYYSYLSRYGLLRIPEEPDWMRQTLAGSWRGYLYTANWNNPEDDVQQIWQMDQFGVCYREDRMRAWPGIITFMESTPELGLFLKDHLLAESRALMRRVEEVMPAWWTIYCPCEQTWETNFQPPEDPHQLFMLSSWVLDEKPERLAWLRNVSWLAQGDLFYVHKLAETIRAYQISPD